MSFVHWNLAWKIFSMTSYVKPFYTLLKFLTFWILITFHRVMTSHYFPVTFYNYLPLRVWWRHFVSFSLWAGLTSFVRSPRPSFVYFPFFAWLKYIHLLYKIYTSSKIHTYVYVYSELTRNLLWIGLYYFWLKINYIIVNTVVHTVYSI